MTRLLNLAREPCLLGSLLADTQATFVSPERQVTEVMRQSKRRAVGATPRTVKHFRISQVANAAVSICHRSVSIWLRDAVKQARISSVAFDIPYPTLDNTLMHAHRISELLAPFLGKPLPDVQLAQFAAYLEILLRWNARMNLTAIRDPEQMITRHFGESLFAAQRLYPHSPEPGARLLDIGSGAGFPGIPIKISAPEVDVTLIESQNKKATFLKEVIRTLDL